MMIEKAMVLSYENGKALVQCYAKSGCGGCAAQNHCGSKALSGLSGEKTAPRFEIQVDQALKARRSNPARFGRKYAFNERVLGLLRAFNGTYWINTPFFCSF